MSDPLHLSLQSSGLTLDSIHSAHTRLLPHIHQTPILTSHQMNIWLTSSPTPSTQFFFKAESFQRTGSFKFRGALNALTLAHLNADHRPVVTHSSGNHGQALACAAAIYHIPAWIVVPKNASVAKINAIKAYGGKIVRCENTAADRALVANKVITQVNGVLVHPYLDRRIIAGQATVGVEIMNQMHNHIDAVVVPIGGGGLISGIALAVKSTNPNVTIIGAEPKMANAAWQSMEKGERVQINGVVTTVADGVRASVGSVAWEVVKRLVDCVITVTEEDIIAATRMVWQRMKVVIEPTAGVGVAAVRTDQFKKLGLKRVVVVLCGGNVDVDNLPWI